jgi:PPM family protein phosphatase
MPQARNLTPAEGEAHEGSGLRPSRGLIEAAQLESRQPVTVDAFGITDRGRVREKNEDQFLIADLERSVNLRQSSVRAPLGATPVEAPQGTLLMVADGMGGYGHGEVASSVAVQAMTRYALAVMPWLVRHGEASEEELGRALSEALQHCHQSVQGTALREGLDQRMGTTLTLAYVTWPELHIAHAGDSRGYLWRSGELRRITQDQTLAEQLVKEKALSPEEAQRSRFRHILVNTIGGTDRSVRVELSTLVLQPGDQLLLCSDGLNAHVQDARIAELLATRQPARNVAAALVAEANAGGGTDNVTVVLARF